MRTEESIQNTRKMVFIVIMLSIFTIAFAASATALGVGPSRQYINFEAGQKIEGKLMIINDGSEEFKAVVYAQGDLAEYVKIKKPLMDVSSTEATKQVEYTIKFPDKPPRPGEHKLEIVIRQFPKSSRGDEETTVSANIAVISQIMVKVPYPGKYAEGKLFISGSEKNETATSFVVMMYNFGTEEITSAHMKTEIFGPTWEKLAETTSDTVSAMPQQETKLEAKWIPNVNKGTYHATATVYYDDKEFSLEENFNVGTFMIDVDDISVKKFRLGDVAKFDITLFNSWNTEIKDIYVEMTIEDSNGKQMTEFKTAAIDIAAQKSGKLEAYWYTEGVAPGIYKVKLLVHYADKVTAKEYDFEVSTNSITKLGGTGLAISGAETGEMTTKGLIILLIIITLVLLIGMNLLWFYKLSKFMKGKDGKGGEQ